MSDNYENRIIRLEDQMIEARNDIEKNAAHIDSIKKECVDKCSLVDQLFIKIQEFEKKFAEIPKEVEKIVDAMINKTKLSIIGWVATVIIGSTACTLGLWYTIDRNTKKDHIEHMRAVWQNDLLKLKNEILSQK